mgnify:CR=1 FL=1
MSYYEKKYSDRKQGIEKVYPSGHFILSEVSKCFGVIYVTVGSLIVGSSFVYAKKFLSPLKIHFAALTSYQLGFALVLLLFITDYEGIENIASDTHVFLGTLIGLGLLGTGLAYILYYFIIEKLGAVTASSATYVPPVIALLIGYLFVDEEIGLLDCLATLFIFAGVFLINKKKKEHPIKNPNIKID